ncbi:hypothetical protein EUX98_g3348 [Antrodiella citrinella]|uniref:Reverse transcriptase n=1 Tax=Antrodiella citrinella TaxID=2447956 RepID=A0A4S4N4Y3_9APHY|nr:hypothetical protein EUX98_g3348 [Antrodiella citrinella]
MVCVLPGMQVPVLLGEDFQETYEIGIRRSVTQGKIVTFGDSGYHAKAQNVARTAEYLRLRRSAAHTQSFVKAKLHKRSRADRGRRRAISRQDKKLLRAACDVRIPANTCKSVKVTGYFDEDKEWMVEKTLLNSGMDDFFAVPNVLISARLPIVPVANTSNRPRMIRQGDILGQLVDPETQLEHPVDAEHLQSMQQVSARYSAIIEAFRQREVSELDRESYMVFRMDEKGVSHPQEVRLPPSDAPLEPEPPPGKDHTAEPELWGPKTAEVADSSVYLSKDLEKILDVGDLPEHLREEAFAMLKRRIKAFGFDGRLGHLETRCNIRTKEGTQPIAVPMYASSPAKRQVIEEQLEKWFEQEVIEPSKSPWSAPVVIIYRNGKPRFCVDYRKLNTMTIPDEFPIPRQNEILSALSGAQVLSSLDALSGFTQIEMAEEDIEKTAFRTHKGLFQFRRMPFGLRNGPSIFQRTMQSILAPYLWLFCLVYIDDIVVYSKSYEDHIQHLDQVLKAVEDAGLTLSPPKCHLFYGSILLLGHKVSRLGLSTHAEKVRAISEVRRPEKLSQLQTFLGMVVYFSSFIPFYAGIAAPLFQLLRKGVKWHWGAEQEHAFESAKKALQNAPILGHPIEGRPYRLYTDASDEALGCALQQVQPIKIGDLKGTKLYERLAKMHEEGKPLPRLAFSASPKVVDVPEPGRWATKMDDTIVHVERVIGYWSRTFKDAETRYSATEREALAAKEGLVKFQPFVEGEKTVLVTDHAALQWARTYENANKRLSAWGTVFSAFAPDLEIVHRPGRQHSNVDPLSRLPRAPPEHTSPVFDDFPALKTDEELMQQMEDIAQTAAAPRMANLARIENFRDVLDMTGEVQAVGRKRRTTRKNYDVLTRSETERRTNGTKTPPASPPSEAEFELGSSHHAAEEGTQAAGDPYEVQKLWEATHRPPMIHIELSSDILKRYVDGYRKDPAFRQRWESEHSNADSWDPAFRFFKDDRGLLFFRDADFQPRLCVPKPEQAEVLADAHQSAYVTAHAGPEKLWELLSSRFYWPRMKKDVDRFCKTCDICQKTKPSTFSRYGRLTPNPIPVRPYDSISMDLIVNLPWSNDFNAILVIVDRLSKHAQFIPTTTGLNAEGFAALFVRHVACRFGLPTNIISDRDPRWTSEFWRQVAKLLQVKMMLSSSHHPQHDGQTEIVNRRLEIMLRAYVAGDRTSWAEWLPFLEHAYNSTTHNSTGCTPYSLIYTFEPRSPLDYFLAGVQNMSKDVQAYADTAKVRLESARLAVAKAQVKQAKSYNKGRRAMEFSVGELVLVNPHSLEWVESKGEGGKLVQRWIGPFEVQQRINEHTYRLRLGPEYPGSPVFNLQHLKAFNRSPDEFGTRDTLPMHLRALRPADDDQEVEKIVGHKYNKTKKAMMYLVRWIGYSPLHDEWMTARELRNAPEILFAYRKEHQL